MIRKVRSAVEHLRQSMEDCSGKQAMIALVLLFAVLCAEFLFFHFDFFSGVGIHGCDGQEYYAWLRSLIVDGDLDFWNEFTEGSEPHHIAPWVLKLRTADGRVANITGIGCAILWSPFFALAAGLSWLSGAPIDGYNPYFQFLIPFGSVIYGGFAIWLSYRLCRLCFDRAGSLLGTAGVFLGTTTSFMFSHYPILSHLMATTLVSAFLYIAFTGQTPRPLSRWALLGILLGLIGMVRYPAVLVAVVLPAQLFTQLCGSTAEQRKSLFLRHSLGGIALALGFLIGFFPQLLAWKALYGTWFADTYGVGQGRVFDLACPYLLDVLFSWKHGLVAWTPVAGLAIVGLVVMAARSRGEIPIALASFFAAWLYMLGCFKWWSFSEIYGNRGFVELTPVFAFGLASLWQKHKLTGLMVTVVAALQNHLFIWAWQNGFQVKSYADIIWAHLASIERILIKLGGLIGKLL